VPVIDYRLEGIEGAERIYRLANAGWRNQRLLSFRSEKIWRMRFVNFAMIAPSVTRSIRAGITFSM
jgi:hypothetical protein